MTEEVTRSHDLDITGGGGRLGISSGFTFAHHCTLWVGHIPAELLRGSVEEGERRFKALFAPFGGKVISASTRKKEGHCKSWGLVRRGSLARPPARPLAPVAVWPPIPVDTLLFMAGR